MPKRTSGIGRLLRFIGCLLLVSVGSGAAAVGKALWQYRSRQMSLLEFEPAVPLLPAPVAPATSRTEPPTASTEALPPLPDEFIVPPLPED